MARRFPRQDVLEIEKTPKWFAEHLDFCWDLIYNTDFRTQKMNRLYGSYNGITLPASVKYLTDTYGWKNRNKYIDYRVGRTKLDILHGEFLKAPLKSTIRTINSDAILKKQDIYDMNLGAAHVKDHLGSLKNFGVDPMEGMQVQDPKDPEFQSKIKPKDRYEIIMQRIIDALIDEIRLKEKLGSSFKDAEIVARAFGQVVINEHEGTVDWESIDPRDGIFFEFDKDPFLEKSFLRGRRKAVPINEILTNEKLTNSQRNKLEEIRNNFNQYVGNPDYRGKYSIVNGLFVVSVIHIEWMGMTPKYTKRSPKTKNQMEFSAPGDGFLDLDITAEGYERKHAEALKAGKKGDENTIIEWTEELYEATRIGHDLDINMGPKKFVMKDEDSGRPISSYSGCVIHPVDGEALSLQELIDNFSNIYNIVQYQLLRELSKMKGKVIAFDRGMLPKGVSPKKMLYRMLNDSLMDFSSSGQTNMAGKDLPIERLLKEFDLGLSASFASLVQFRNDIVNTISYITGINSERVGDISASSTATNAMSAVEASRTITEALFYYFHTFSEEVVMKLAESSKIVWGLWKPEKLRTILGDSDFDYLQANPELADQKYGVYLTNGLFEKALKDRLRTYVEAYANSKELRFIDVMDFELSDSLAAAKVAIEAGWEKVQKMRQDEMASQQQSTMAAGQQQAAAQQQAASQGRSEDLQSKITQINEKGKVDIMVDTAKAKNKAVLSSHDSDLENFNSNE